ncbi:MAG: hypothetical protein KBA26_05600 [Candidatus Delongbacteria bacterium]|nr:hypothetical protein [Candidatus Delongbacteria bacterium]
MKASKSVSIFLISMGMISMELIWTRIFSAEFFYTFAFLILSLAILGMGLGSLGLRFFSGLNRESLLPYYINLTGLTACLMPLLVFNLGLDFTRLAASPFQLIRLLVAILGLGIPYFLAGLSIGLLFKKNHSQISTLYAYDLAGAGMGVIAAVLFMNWVGVEKGIWLVGLSFLVSAFILARKYHKIVSLGLMLLVIIGGWKIEDYSNQGRKEPAPVIYRHWDAMGKIKVYRYDADYYGLNIDNAANSPVYHFDGNWNKPDSEQVQFNIDMGYLIRRYPACRFLSLGAGGGSDVLQALKYGAAKIWAVEINSHINQMMTDGFLLDFSGRIYRDPRVEVVTDDARSFVRSHPNQIDFIFSLSSNTFSALGSGAFALAENYLFTVEAFEDYWNALSDSGMMMMEHQFYVPRLVSELIIALQNQGVPNPEQHFAVYHLPQLRRMAIILSKAGLDSTTIQEAFSIPLTSETAEYIRLLYPTYSEQDTNPISRIVHQGWENVQPEIEYDLSPVTDNRPFAAQLGLWKNFSPAKLQKLLPYEFYGFPLSKLILITILAIVGMVIIPINLLPFFKRDSRFHAAAWLYFFMIGMGFMMLEIVLTQKYALLIGSSIYAVMTVLFGMLIFSGLGSRFSSRVSLSIAVIGIMIWIAVESMLFPGLVELTRGGSIAIRIALAILVMAPLGLGLGIPFPHGIRKAEDTADWALAVNGAASVIGAVLAVLISSTFGFKMAQLTVIVCYTAAWITDRQWK